MNRFFALSFVLLFILSALDLMQLITLGEIMVSSNPLGVPDYYDRVPFAPYSAPFSLKRLTRPSWQNQVQKAMTRLVILILNTNQG